MVSVPISYGVKRNFQIFDPLDFLAELTQHIPNKGEHLIRYYGHYSNKARGMRSRNAPESRSIGVPRSTGILPVSPTGVSPVENSALRPPAGNANLPIGTLPPAQSTDDPPALSPSKGRRWAMLIQRVYHADPLLCPRCGGTMKIIAFIEAHQQSVIRKILQHCGLWQDPPSRSPPKPATSPPGPKSGHQASLFAGDDDPDSRLTHEVDPDFLEFVRREEIEEAEPTWEL